MTPKFRIGTQYKTRGKHPRLCTVVDILTTRSQVMDGQGKGALSIRYVSEHEFAGQRVVDRDVVETTIAMGLISEPTCEHEAIRLTGKFETENLECACGFRIPF